MLSWAFLTIFLALDISFLSQAGAAHFNRPLLIHHRPGYELSKAPILGFWLYSLAFWQIFLDFAPLFLLFSSIGNFM